jgi:hypothetical protein
MAYGIRALDDPDGFRYSGPILKEYSPTPGTNFVTNSTLGQNSLYFQPFDLPVGMTANRINFYLSVATTISAGNSTGRGGYTLSAAIYTHGSGTQSDRIGTLWSGSAGISISMTSNTAITVTNVVGILNSTAVSTTRYSTADANATTYVANSVGGYRVLGLPISSTMTPGRYYLAVANSTTSSNAGVCIVNCSVLQQTNNNAFAYKPFGTSSVASNIGYGLPPGPVGTYSAVSAAFPATVALTTDNIKGAGTVFMPYFNLSGITTSVNTI